MWDYVSFSCTFIADPMVTTCRTGGRTTLPMAPQPPRRLHTCMVVPREGAEVTGAGLPMADLNMTRMALLEEDTMVVVGDIKNT